MGDSDDEYDRRRVRDKFKRERSDYQDRYSGSSRGGGREDWPDSRESSGDWGRNSSGRSGDRMNNRGSDGRYSNDRYGNQRRDRYGSPGDRSDMSPPMKRVRNTRPDWDERGNYSSSNNFEYPHSGGTWNPIDTGISPHSLNSAVAAATFNSNTSTNTHQSVGPTQPPMMTFKQFLATQDDSVDDMDAVKKYNDYKTDFKKQQIASFFTAHKEEEWFKSKYHPDEFGKRKEESHQALKNRLNVFMELYDKGLVDSVSIDVEKSDSIIRLLDAAVIKLEGGTDFDLKALDTKLDASDDKPKASDLEVFQVDVEKPPPKKEKKEKPEEGEEAEEGEEGEEGEDGEEIDKKEDEDSDMKSKIKEEIKDEDSQNVPVKEEPVESAESVKNMDENTGECEDFKDSKVNIKVEPSEDMEDGEDGEASMSKELAEEKDQIKEEGEEEDSVNEQDEKPETKGSGLETEEKMDESDEPKKDSANEPNDDEPKPRPLHLKDSIFLRNIAPNITKAEIEEICKKHPGFLRVHIADPAPDRKFYRRGWVTFEKLGNIREICLEMLSIKIKECELGAIVNRDLTRRIRSVNGIASHKNVVRADIRNAAKIVFNLDHQRRVWDDHEQEKRDANEPKTKEEVAFGFQSCNPLLKNIADYMIEEASAEEEELLGDQAGEEEGEESPGQSLERDENLIKVLDRLLLYLRIVHSVDYYNHSDYPNEDEMPNRIGIMHARGAPPSCKVTSQEINEYIKAFEQKIKPYLQPLVIITEEEALKLGKKDEEKEVEDFIQHNTQEIGKDKWLCPLSGKKFKGPDFVRKHILNKHEDRLHQVRKEVEYFNNYLSDPKRPALPEHPSNRPANAQTGTDKNNPPTIGHNGPTTSANAWAHPAGFPTAPGFPGFPLRSPLPFANPMAAWTALSRNYQPMAPNLDYSRGGHQAAAAHAAAAAAAAAAATLSRNRYGARHDPRAVVGYADLDDNLEMI